MELTRITDENAEHFKGLCSSEYLQNKNYIKLGAILEGEAVSACALGVDDDMAQIHWLYTDPGQREKGGATFLMEQVMGLLEGLALDGIRVDFDAEDEGLDTFLMEQGFMVGEDRSLYRVPLTELLFGARMEAMLAHRSQAAEVHSLQHLTSVKPLLRLMKEYGLDPVFIQNISIKYSFLVSDPEGKETGAILMSESEEGDLHVNFMIGDGSPQGMIDLVAALHDALMKDERFDGDLVFSDRIGMGASFVEMMTGIDGDSYRVSGPMYAVKLLSKNKSA